MCLDSMGAEAARPFIERAQPPHPSLIDVAHVVDERFGVVNIPNSVWIDEAGAIVRPAEAAWPDAPDAPEAPDLVLPDLDGQPFELASLRGQKVVLVAWSPY